MIYRFGEFELDTGLYELRRLGEVCPAEPMVFDLITHFVRHPNTLFSHDDLIAAVWSGRIVSDTTVATCVKNARRVLGDSGSSQTMIKTVRGRGFRFVADVESDDARGPAGQSDEPVPDKTAGAVIINTSTVSGEPAATMSTGSAAPISEFGRPCVAVLPLQNISSDPNKFLFGDAIAQEIIVDLSKLHWLAVVARGSSFQFRDGSADLPAVSRMLSARYILTGSIEVFANHSIVMVEFSDAPESRVLWAERFECKVEELLVLRHRLSTRIVAEIETRIQATEAERAARLPTENLDAWAAYHRGLWHMYRFNRSDNEAAREMFIRATQADSQFARAYSGLSFTHFQNSLLRYSDEISADQKLAREFAQKGLELDPLDPFTNLTMGRCAWMDSNLESAGQWLQRGLQLSPNYAFAMYNGALIDVLMGHGEKAEEGVSEAMQLSPIDPLNYAMFATRAMSHSVRAEHDVAIGWADKAVREPTAHVHIVFIAAFIHELAGNHERCDQLLTQVRSMNPDYTLDLFIKSFPFRDSMMRDAAMRAAKRLAA